VNALFGDIASLTGDTVTLTDGRTARFASRWTPLLEQLHQRGMPVYLELDASNAVTRVRIPNLVRVDELTDSSVTFDQSSARHDIDPGLAERLRASQHRRLAVTTNDAGDIIDVRPYD
jgi:hypothetical protein